MAKARLMSRPEDFKKLGIRPDKVEMWEDGYEKSVSCEELLLAAYDAIGRIFTQKALVKAYYNTNPAI